MMRKTSRLLIALWVGCAHEGPDTSEPSTQAADLNPSQHTAGAAGSTPRASGGEQPVHAPTHGYDKDFSSVQAYAARFDSSARDAWQKPGEVVRLMDLQPGQSVADVGAGTGYFLGPLSEAVGPAGQVLALDTEPNMVRYMQQRARDEGWDRVEARVVAADDPGLARGSVDRVLIVNTWHHISDRTLYARMLREALREGGAVVIVDFTRESDQGPPQKYRLTPQQVMDELSAAGFETRAVEETLPKQYVVIGVAP